MTGLVKTMSSTVQDGSVYLSCWIYSSMLPGFGLLERPIYTVFEHSCSVPLNILCIFSSDWVLHRWWRSYFLSNRHLVYINDHDKFLLDGRFSIKGRNQTPRMPQCESHGSWRRKNWHLCMKEFVTTAMGSCIVGIIARIGGIFSLSLLLSEKRGCFIQYIGAETTNPGT